MSSIQGPCLLKQTQIHKTNYLLNLFCPQTRLSEYGFAARYKGTIGDKAKEKERLANLEAEELIDSGEKMVNSV